VTARVERTCLSEGPLGLGWGYHWSGEPAPDRATWDAYYDWAYEQWAGKMGPVPRRLADGGTRAGRISARQASG
jgi:hypothetical protein